MHARQNASQNDAAASPPDSAEPAEWFDDKGLKFSCTQCGNCCSGPPGFVWFNEDEATQMAINLGITRELFLDTYARKLRGRWSLIEVRKGDIFDCVFLRRDPQGKAQCSIYQARPQQCKTWPFWPELLTGPKAWKEASRRCPGMDTGTHYPAEKIRLIRASNPQA